ncbi:hypothetical protein K402DRAFT_396129 [Aulographum hederae CBS 113979]|uniref:tRNA-splicing endonuclease subunit Sen15 domain-containing protein n=1 Tax=Aulographum hederae CBS 113979 TaxID=1176131 RepID=A0A6G1GT03_9PEZI|nr:hypothetical protein K402DRAFT_396129 [Aulographum hederae CBS 113979]
MVTITDPIPPSTSSLQSLLDGFNKSLSKISNSAPSNSPATLFLDFPSPHFRNLALQIAHNLQYQHRWTNLRIHTHSPRSPQRRLPRPLVSGLPPRRLYVHPDEQIEILKREAEAKGKGKGKQNEDKSAGNGTSSGSGTGRGNENGEGEEEDQEEESEMTIPQLEWVLPTSLRETWSLRRMAEVFDLLSPVPPTGDSTSIAFEEVAGGADSFFEWGREGETSRKREVSSTSEAEASKWRQMKRVVLATLDDDSTVVYYIVHDGVVKPRQNG